MHVVPLIGACKSGPWGDVQVLQGGEAMTTHMEGWLSAWVAVKERYETIVSFMKAKCEGCPERSLTMPPRGNNILLIA